jgi:hypothetical protein
MSSERHNSIFGVVLWPAIKTYICVSLLGVAIFFAQSVIADDTPGGGLGVSEVFAIIFGYGIFSLVLGLFVAFPSILLVGGLMNRLAKKHRIFGSAAAFAFIGLIIGAALMIILDWSISVRPTIAAPAMLGGTCAVIGSLLFRHFTTKA